MRMEERTDNFTILSATSFLSHPQVSNSLTYYMQLMADHPEIQAKVQHEIDGMVPADHFVSLADIEQLPYFWATVKSAMACRPLFTFTVARETYLDFTWRGVHVPAGTFIPFVAPVQLTDSDKFDPSRFINEKSPRLDITGQNEPTAAFFGGGIRVCPGAALAEKELGLVATNILKCFTVSTAADGCKCRQPTKPDGMQFPPIHVPLKFTPRHGVNVDHLLGLQVAE